jgi:glucose-1-phosphate adenylyltransferase
VRVNSYSSVVDSVILPDVEIGRHCDIRKAIIDCHCHIAEGTSIGVDPAADRARGFHISSGGVTLVTPEMLGQGVNTVR